MKWTGIEIDVPSEDLEDTVVQVLMLAGCAGVALKGEGAAKTVSSYIPTDDRAESRIRQISGALSVLSQLGVDSFNPPRITSVDEEDWANTWKKYFKPLRVGRRLVVTPPWETPELRERDLVITIDPGMAFGTGTHATTQLCMALLEEYLEPDMNVADIGTGSGILAITAMKLGAVSVDAIDNDPLAVRIAKENSVVNQVRVSTSDALPDGAIYDLVVANIIADTIIELADTFYSITKPSGILIVSGIIEDRQVDVRIFLEGAGFSALETRTQGEWVALVFRRISN